MRRGLLLALISIQFLCIAIPASAQEITEITDITVTGTCREYSVTVTATGLGQGCWDVKLEIPGTVFDYEKDEWRSSYYFVDGALCGPDASRSFAISLDSSMSIVQAKARIRSGSREKEKPFTISQSCPAPAPPYIAILAAIIVILIFGYALAWWWKQGK